jgi:hypothetical protein
MFLETEIVELRQTCFTPGRMFEPGYYRVEELPDVAFDMGLVDKLPADEGKLDQGNQPS